MKNHKFIIGSMYGLVSLTLVLTSCGGGGVGMPSGKTGVGQVRQVSGERGRTAVLRSISITPNNPLAISSGTRIQFTALGFYLDSSVQDITALVMWVSSDPSVATISNEAASIGLATTVSKGYCSISVSFGGVSGSTIIGVN